ncbi:uncharacterized protein LOC132757310 [Ruditapes philippinarum]|uniref:uncharacterized protein LOC132757310 n=1 Tax=Ruditapes philippinarum TaxID=129788 RepID=UPI00295B92E1|nr:uncharacterized protein LOC132757310 [Ruditapes philippinarum]
MFKGTGKDLPIAVNASIIGHEAVWVGYYLAATAFHYVGCIKKENMAAIAEFEYNTPGLCYSACNMTYSIGVSESKCYCFNNTIPSDRTYHLCTQGCKTQMNIACGSNNYISIYTIYSYANLFSGSGRCLQYEFKNYTSTWMWENCGSGNQIICRFNDTYIIEIYKENGNIKKKWWRPSMNECFKLSKLPTSVKDLEHLERGTNLGKSWAGVISSDVIYRSDHEAPYMELKQFGYLQRNETNDIVLLKFDKENKIQRFTLCKNESAKRPGDDKSKQTKTDQVSATIATDIGIAVGVSVAIFITVVTIVVGFIIIRRGKVPSLCCKKALHDQSSKSTMNTFIVNNSNTIPLECHKGKVGEVIPQTAIVSEDDVLENSGHRPHDNFILEKTETDYSTTYEIADSNSCQVEVNVYNTLTSSVKLGGNFDNTYDTAEKAAMKLKPKHGEKDKSFANETMEETDDDPYNHLYEGEQLLKNVRTDHVYGVTQYDEYANCRKSLGKHLQDVEDTYNHTITSPDAQDFQDVYNHTNQTSGR